MPTWRKGPCASTPTFPSGQRAPALSAIDYEAKRHIETLKRGEAVSPETRTYDVTQSKTIRIRGKEDEVDYRFMPEPDLLPLVVTDAMLEGAKDRIPVLPRDSAVDLVKSHGGSGLGFHEAWLLVLDAGAEAFFRDATALLEERLHTQLLNWMFTEVFGVMRSKDVPITEVAVTAVQLSELVKLIDSNTLSGRMAKDVFARMVDGDTRLPGDIADAHGMVQISDGDELEAICRQVLDNNPKEVATFQGGKRQLIGFFVGQVMKQTKGQANPPKTKDLILKLLE